MKFFELCRQLEKAGWSIERTKKHPIYFYSQRLQELMFSFERKNYLRNSLRSIKKELMMRE